MLPAFNHTGSVIDFHMRYLNSSMLQVIRKFFPGKEVRDCLHDIVIVRESPHIIRVTETLTMANRNSH